MRNQKQSSDAFTYLQMSLLNNDLYVQLFTPILIENAVKE